VIQKTLSRDEIDIAKILLALMEGFDTIGKISYVTNIKKERVRRLLYALKHAGFAYLTPERKRWRLNVNADFFWTTSQQYAYERGVFQSLHKMKEVIDAQT
jgi:DNA-binding IclR family transcriptional regulator